MHMFRRIDGPGDFESRSTFKLETQRSPFSPDPRDVMAVFAP